MSGRLRGSVFCVLMSSPFFASFAFAAPPPSKVHVLYLVQNAAITTYNVDASNGKATRRSTLKLSAAQAIIAISPSPNDHFAYVQWLDSKNDQRLSVYATTAQGALRAGAVQTI